MRVVSGFGGVVGGLAVLAACGGESATADEMRDLDSVPADTRPGAEQSSDTPFDDPASEPVPDDDPVSVEPGTTEFIPWEDLENAGTGEPLAGPLELASVSEAPAYDDAELLVAVVTDGGRNRVIAVSTETRTYRDYVLPFECGDCKASATASTTVIGTSTQVFGSTGPEDGYFEIALAWDGTPEELRAVEDQVWVFNGGIWVNAPLSANQTFALMPWTRSVTSVWGDTGLQVTQTNANRLRADGEHEEYANPCPSKREYYEYGSGFHEGERAAVACAGNTIAVTGALGQEPFALWELDAPVVFIGSHYLASEASWYRSRLEGPAVGKQGSLREGETVFGHVAHEGLGLRVSSLGIAVSGLEASLPDGP